MAIPDYQTLMLPVLRLFGEGATNVADCLPKIVEEFGITPEEEREMIPSGRVTLLANRVHWARTYLSKAGLLASPRRNLHEIKPEGRAVLARRPERIDNAFLSTVPEFREWRARSATSSETDSSPDPTGVAELTGMPNEAAGATPEEAMDAAMAELNATLAEDLRAEVLKLTPVGFERLILDLMMKMGYGGGTTGGGRLTPATADGGIDGIIFEDALGLDAVYLQAKRYSPDIKVGRPDIQGFVGSLTGEGANKGVFVTTSDFTREAREYVKRVPHRIILIDGTLLSRLMVDHEVGVRSRQTYVRRSIDEDYFSETQ